MLRHLSAYVPECAVTVVERDPIVRDFARRFFHIKRPIVMADAEHVVAESRGKFDVVLVDCYDSRGATAGDRRFWRACLRALKPDGCIAANWADFAGAAKAEGAASRLAAAAERTFFVSEPIQEPNVVQYAPTLRGFRRSQLSTRLRRFAADHDLPREDRDILKRCRLLTRYEDAEDDVD
jgi:spermidine synthase